MASIFIRTSITYLLLVFSMKLMGKRQIGELEINELVSTLLISEIAAMPITEPDIPFLNAIIPILFIVSAEILVSFIKNKISPIKKIIEGDPAYLIYNGKIDESALGENRISVNELLCEMRLQSIFDIKDVKFAILEQSGNISFLSNTDSGTMIHYVIIDGNIEKKALNSIGKNKEWLLEQLKEHKMELSDVFLLGVDENNNLSFTRKEKK